MGIYPQIDPSLLPIDLKGPSLGPTSVTFAGRVKASQCVASLPPSRLNDLPHSAAPPPPTPLPTEIVPIIPVRSRIPPEKLPLNQTFTPASRRSPTAVQTLRVYGQALTDTSVSHHLRLFTSILSFNRTPTDPIQDSPTAASPSTTSPPPAPNPSTPPHPNQTTSPPSTPSLTANSTTPTASVPPSPPNPSTTPSKVPATARSSSPCIKSTASHSCII